MANARTLRKRIALVAAAALGVGLLVATPANAATIASSAVNSINLTTYTAAPAVGLPVVVNAGAATAVTTPVTIGDSTKFIGYLSSYPAGGFSQVTPATTLGGGFTATPITNGLASVSGSALVETATATTFGGNTIFSSISGGLGSFSFTPLVAGTYILSVWNDANGDGTVNIGEAVQTIAITVGSASTYSAGYSTAYIAAGATQGTNPLAFVSASMAYGTQAANITVTLKNSANAPINGEIVSATVSGPGLIGITAGPTTYNQPSAGRALSSSLGSTNNIGNISVWPDGTAGVSTITISVTDVASGATSVLATRSVTFYGAVASLKVISQNYFVAKAGGGAASGLNTGLSAITDTPAVTIAALDASGNVVPGVTITALSSNAAVIAGSTVLEDTTTNDATSFYGGPGYYNATISSSTLATSGQSATVTYQYSPGIGYPYISAPAVTFTIGGTLPASVAFNLDSATYAPGAKATLKVTAKDSAGNAVADGTYANLLAVAATSNAAVQGNLPGVGVTTRKGVAVYTLYAPVNPVAFTISGTLGISTAVAGTAVSASATVTATPDPATAANAAAIAAAQTSIAALTTTTASLFASISYQVRVLNVLIKRIMAKLHIR